MPDRHKVGQTLVHRMGPAARPSDTAVPGPNPEPANRDLVVLQVLNASKSAGQNQDVRPLADDRDMERSAVVDLNRQRAHD